MSNRPADAARAERRAHNRALFARLRASYGALPWLTIVSGVTATAYRLAGMTGEELHALLGSEGGLINIQTRRKPLMRLRAGFDGSTGAIKDENGLVTMFFSFGLGRFGIWRPPSM